MYNSAMKILLLEDDVSLNLAIKKVTLLDKHETTCFVDGDDVYNSLSQRYDLYILDINVPNINGLELLKLLYEQDPTTKVIIISANTDIASLKKAYSLGCIDYLKKPFHLEELRIKIAKIAAEVEIPIDTIKLYPEATLTKKEKMFLSLLLANNNKTVTYEMIENHLYSDKYMSMESLRALVKRLRSKIVDDVIQNVKEEGYKLLL